MTEITQQEYRELLGIEKVVKKICWDNGFSYRYYKYQELIR